MKTIRNKLTGYFLSITIFIMRMSLLLFIFSLILYSYSNADTISSLLAPSEENSDEGWDWSRLDEDTPHDMKPAEYTKYYNLAMAYETGIGQKKDLEKAISYYAKIFYQRCNDVRKDAFLKLEKLAKEGNPQAEYLLGYRYMLSPYTEKKGAELIKSAARKKYVKAMTFVATRKPMSQGNRIAILKEAAKQNHVWPSWELATRYIMYRDEDDVMSSYSDAVKYMEKAARLMPEAEYYLGACYFYGIGVPEDRPKGVQYIESAIRKGYDKFRCFETFISIYYKGIGGVGNEKKAKQLYYDVQKLKNRAEIKKDFEYLVKNSSGYERLCGVFMLWHPMPYPEYKRYYYAINEAICSLLNLGDFLTNEGDSSFSMGLVKLIAEQGSDAILYNLGICHFYGLYIPQSKEKAIKYWSAVKEDKDILPLAKLALARCYHQGLGVKKDSEKAKFLCKDLPLIKNRPAEAFVSGKNQYDPLEFYFHKLSGEDSILNLKELIRSY